jgi:hypothetical protein
MHANDSHVTDARYLAHYAAKRINNQHLFAENPHTIITRDEWQLRGAAHAHAMIIRIDNNKF